MTKLVFLTVVLSSLLLCSTYVSADEITAEQVIAKHLDSIATENARKTLKTLFVTGLSSFDSRNPLIKGVGKAVVVSDPTDLYFLMSINSTNYRYEKIGAFGSTIALPFTTGNDRSLLGSFLHEHYRILSQNLFCGSMSLRWLQSIGTDKDLKLKYAGKKKFGGQLAHAINVMLTGYGTDDFIVKLFFDVENFHHIGTQYERSVPVGFTVMGSQNSQAETHLTLTEEFGDYRTVDGFTFPYSYRVKFASNAIDAQTAWGINVANYFLNQKLAPDFFTFDIER
jgi:hypothetical protein